jgi:glycosyltransferase involved in cell wall biosynthesis
VKVSVIVPVYNHAKYLRQRLDSILSQTYKDYELIILDDASTDNSREIIQEYLRKNPEIVTGFNDQNSGSPFKQWNRGVGLASGDYLWIAESDDFAEPAFLETAVSEIRKSDEIGLVFCDTCILDEEKGIMYRFSDRKKNPERNGIMSTAGALLANPIPNVSSVLFRREAYIKAGWADEKMRFCGDWFQYMKIIRISEIRYISDAFSTCRLHENSHYHDHYRSNSFLKERLKVSSFLLKQIGLSFTALWIFKDICKSIILRSMHLLNVPEFLMPEIPRRPEKFEYLIIKS